MATPSFPIRTFPSVNHSTHDRRSTEVLGSALSHLHSPCDFVQALMKLQRAAQLITSALDLDVLLERVGQRYRRIDRLC